jgi:hypothetical protein
MRQDTKLSLDTWRQHHVNIVLKDDALWSDNLAA